MPDPIEIHGPVGFWLPEEEALRRPILARISQAQTEGELPARTSGIPRESVAIWIGPKERPHAFALFYLLDTGEVWLDILYVGKPHRNEGLGLLLLQTVEQIALARDIKRIELGTGPLNLPMQRLALKAGWGKRMLVMERKL